jgi:hypothetical protein
MTYEIHIILSANYFQQQENVNTNFCFSHNDTNQDTSSVRWIISYTKCRLFIKLKLIKYGKLIYCLNLALAGITKIFTKYGFLIV